MKTAFALVAVVAAKKDFELCGHKGYSCHTSDKYCNANDSKSMIVKMVSEKKAYNYVKEGNGMICGNPKNMTFDPTTMYNSENAGACVTDFPKKYHLTKDGRVAVCSEPKKETKKTSKTGKKEATTSTTTVADDFTTDASSAVAVAAGAAFLATLF